MSSRNSASQTNEDRWAQRAAVQGNVKHGKSKQRKPHERATTNANQRIGTQDKHPQRKARQWLGNQQKWQQHALHQREVGGAAALMTSDDARRGLSPDAQKCLQLEEEVDRLTRLLNEKKEKEKQNKTGVGG